LESTEEKHIGETMSALVYNDSCELKLLEIATNSIDAVVTDPPYGLSFMGKHWDYDVPSIDIWREVIRVLKPGGYLLSFGGSRTYHRMACAIEDAGFEIRDQIMWIYGSGFPKSHDIGKAIDKIQGNERVVSRHYIAPDGQWRDCNNHKPNEEIRNPATKYGYKTSGFRPVDKGFSEYEGWGTALKPAHEPICMARKPIGEKTVAENVLKYGTGGINIDGCRVDFQGPEDYASATFGRGTDITGNNYCGATHSTGETNIKANPLGRFPANVIHDGSDEVVGMFPKNAGAAAPVSSGMNGKSNGIYGDFAQKGDDGKTFRGDSGSAARFFYCAKASKSERDKGLEEFDEKRWVQWQTANGTSGKPSSMSEGRNTAYRNDHPTVKPVALMRYLCRLVTPKGGIVLDPFMGSGTTGIAAKIEGFSFIGIERESDYCDIARARIEAWKEEDKPVIDPQQKLF